jgi:phage major head subunit gpT-like protein
MIINQANLEGIYKTFSTIFNMAFSGAVTMWNLVAMEVTAPGASADYKWLGDFPTMKEWLGDRVIKDLSAFKYVIENKDYESTIELDRNMILDDQIGLFNPVVQGLADAAAKHPDILVFAALAAGFATLCYDGQFFIDDDHPVGSSTQSNYGGGSSTAWYLLDLSRPIKPLILQRNKNPEFVAQDRVTDENVFMRKKFRYGVDDRKNVGYGLWQLAYGSKRALDATYYAAARAAMIGRKNEEDVPLGIVPTHCLVPPTLEADGRALLESMLSTAGISNPWYNTAKLVVVPWLA